MGNVTNTPANRWSLEGKPDPHDNQYDCERAKLMMPDHTDDELAYGLASRSRHDLDLICYQEAAKDRIRWLSRSLVQCSTALNKLLRTKPKEKSIAERLALIRNKKTKTYSVLSRDDAEWRVVVHSEQGVHDAYMFYLKKLYDRVKVDLEGMSFEEYCNTWWKSRITVLPTTYPTYAIMGHYYRGPDIQLRLNYVYIDDLIELLGVM